MRPGPIQGDMVHPYLRRRDGDRGGRAIPRRRPSTARRTSLSKVLRKTSACRCSRSRRCGSRIDGGEVLARGGQRACAARWRPSANAAPSTSFEDKMVGSMIARGYDAGIRRALLQPDQGLRRIRLSRKPRRELRPARLCLVLAQDAITRRRSAAALLNSQPMGFYAPAQIVRDAREHGVEVREVDVNHSLMGLHAGACFAGRIRAAPRHAPDRRAARGGCESASSRSATASPPNSILICLLPLNLQCHRPA